MQSLLRAVPVLLSVSFLEAAPLVFNDVEYARPGGVSLRFDASVPPGDGPFPAVVIVHGGAWVRGDRRVDVAPLFQPLADAGFAWFSISYRLAADALQFGAAIDDVAEAVRFITGRAGMYRIDPRRLALIGESAGGQLAAMAALRYPELEIRAVVALYTPTDLVSLAETSRMTPEPIRAALHGSPWQQPLLALMVQLSPIDNVHAGMPPFLFIHGTADPLVPFEQSSRMCDRMKDSGAACEVLPIFGAGHGIRWWEPAAVTTYQSRMIAWLKTRLAA
jgi:alpha-L-fucosidase 2